MIYSEIQICLLNSKIDVLLDTKTKTASLTEVSSQQLVFLDFQSTLKELHSFLSSHSDIASYFLITPDSEGSHSIPSCRREKYRHQRRLNIFNKEWGISTSSVKSTSNVIKQITGFIYLYFVEVQILFNNSKTQSSSNSCIYRSRKTRIKKHTTINYQLFSC